MRLRRLTIVTAVAAVYLAVLTASVPAQQVDPIQAAMRAMGANHLRSIRFSGFGASYSVGQSPSPRETWPRATLKRYEVDIDYIALSMRVQLTREQAPIPQRGGGQPFTGEQRLVQFVSGDEAWDVPPSPSPQPQTVAERQQQIWLTPYGFLRAAAANAATTRRVPQGTEVSFVLGGKRYVGTLDGKYLVTRVQSWIDSPVLGDMPVDAIYRDYEKAEVGVMFPMHMTQSQGGRVSLDVWLSSVQPNVPLEVFTPDAVRSTQSPPAAGK